MTEGLQALGTEYEARNPLELGTATDCSDTLEHVSGSVPLLEGMEHSPVMDIESCLLDTEGSNGTCATALCNDYMIESGKY